MRNCATCGKPVRLRAFRIRIAGRSGVSHYIEHTDGSRMHSDEWSCCTLKPYPRVEADQPWMKMMDRWDAAQEAAEGTCTDRT
jgi:hypothetical protein